MPWFYESFFPVVWILFSLYWQIRAVNTKTTQRLEPVASRILRAFIFLIAIVLLSTTRIPLPWLYLQLWPVAFGPSGWELPSPSPACCSPSGRASILAETGAAPSPLSRATS
jgi:hypothetical protein